MKRLVIVTGAFSLLTSWQSFASELTNLNQVRSGETLKTVLTDSHRQTLYVFDKDNGKSVCNGKCAEVWPPLTLTDDEVKLLPVQNKELSAVKRDSGLNQITFKGRPLYYFHQDRAEGDIKGDGVGGVWHLIEL